MPTSIYTRLTGKQRRFHLFTQLWMAPDHLLLVRSNRFEETYQRFYYKDIQALLVTGVESRTWMQASLGILSVAIVLLSSTLIPIIGWKVLAALVGLIPGIVAIVDFISGARCRMILKTPVSNEPLPPVARISTAKRVISKLKPIIEEAQQGEWNSEMLPAAGPPVMAPRPVAVPPGDRLVIGLFTLVSLNAAICFAVSIWHHNELMVLLIYTVFAEIVLSIAALRRRGDDPRWLLYSFCGVILICAILTIISSLGLFGYFAYTASEDQRNGTQDSARFFELAYPRYLIWWSIGWRLVVGASAWIAFVWTRKPSEAFPDEGGPPSLV